MSERCYSEAEIRHAFWAYFHKSGELWFNYFGTEDECEASTREQWDDFLKDLRAVPES